ncbi:MAG: DUF2058 family protein [Pseudoxanthomonas sp.]|nr:DUF2058 family protein [Pseudoxanthomonas sp.]
MTDSLRDQLLGLGFKPAAKPERKPERRSGKKPETASAGKSTVRPAHKPGGQVRPVHAARAPRQDSANPAKPAKSRAEMDLAKAYALRAQQEKDERIQAERLNQEQARLRREAKLQVEALVKDQVLNDADADIARHFEYGAKIKRIHVNALQLKQLNAGELGVLQQNGRYLLVTAVVLAEAERLHPACVALKVHPKAPAGEDPYADPHYPVPDDLVW